MTALQFTSTLKPQSAIGKYVSYFSNRLIAPSFDQQSQYVVNLWTWLQKCKEATKNHLNKYATIGVALVAAPFIWSIFWFFYKSLQRRYSANIQVTADNYKSLRTEYDRLSQLGIDSKIPDPKKLTIKRAPFFLRGILRLILAIARLINARKNVLRKALEEINVNAPSNDLLRPISESELWQRRTKAYEYRF